MRAYKAHVRAGHVVLDDTATDLPDGTELELVPAVEMSAEDRAALDAALDEAEAESAQGEAVSVEELRARLRAIP